MLADSASESVSRMENAWTTPNASVTGANAVPKATTEAFHIRLTPSGA